MTGMALDSTISKILLKLNGFEGEDADFQPLLVDLKLWMNTLGHVECKKLAESTSFDVLFRLTNCDR